MFFDEGVDIARYDQVKYPQIEKITEKQLAEVGIIYDTLIMGIKGGKRVLINDRKPNGSKNYASAINLTRNEGINNIKIK